MSVQAIDGFRPAAPQRPAKPVNLWRALFGDASRNTVRWWTADSFRVPHITSRVLGMTYHTVSDPDAIKRVLLDNVAGYGKPALLRRAAPLIADGVLGAEGEDWKSQRRLMAPVFTPAAIGEFMPIFTDVARETADRWVQAPGVIDVAAGATWATFDIISRALFSDGHGLSGDEARTHVEAMLVEAGDSGLLRMAALQTGLQRFNPTRRARAARKAEAFLRERLTAFIKARRKNPAPPTDFMSRLLDAFDADCPPKEAAALALSNAVTFLVAGHETTSNALAWTLYLLSEDRQAQAWAAEEARAALTPGATGADVLEKLTWLRWVVEEAMRLYPPAPRMERQALADDRLGDLKVRKGDIIGIWPWVLHRHEALWENPDVFDPARFAPEARSQIHRFQYIPFGAGPRVCIGAQFAMAEALLILAEWLARFEFAPVPGHKVQLVSDLTLRPEGGLPLEVTPRAA